MNISKAHHPTSQSEEESPAPLRHVAAPPLPPTVNTTTTTSVRGRVAIAFPADFDTIQATECLERALQPTKTTTRATTTTTTSSDHGTTASFDVQLDHVTKATLSVDFIATATTTASDLTKAHRDEVASRLAAHQESLKQSLANCIVWLGERHNTANFLISRRPTTAVVAASSASSSSSPSSTSISKDVFAFMCRANVFDTIDNALTQTATQLHLASHDEKKMNVDDDHHLRQEFFQKFHSELLLATNAFPPCCKECSNLRAQRQEQHLSHQLTVATLQRDIAHLRAELECIGASHKSLESDVHILSLACNEITNNNRELTVKLNASELEADKLRAELEVWRRRAEDADNALLLTVEVSANEGGGVKDGGAVERREDAGTSSLVDNENDTELLQRILTLRETQVAQLNKQLIASRKETTESRRQVQQQQAAMREWALSSNASNSSRSSSVLSSLGPSSRGVSEEQVQCGDTSCQQDMVPRSAVLALQRRCETAELDLRERTMQIAELLKVRRAV